VLWDATTIRTPLGVIRPNSETVECVELRQNATTRPAITSPTTMRCAVYLVSSMANRTAHTVTHATQTRQLWASHRVVGLFACGAITPRILTRSLFGRARLDLLSQRFLLAA
jgi:hypothetical protein